MKEDMHACKNHLQKWKVKKKSKGVSSSFIPFPRLISTHFKFPHHAKKPKHLSHISQQKPNHHFPLYIHILTSYIDAEC